MTRRTKATVLLVVTAILLAAVVGVAARGNGSERGPQPASDIIAPSPYPHAWEAKR